MVYGANERAARIAYFDGIQPSTAVSASVLEILDSLEGDHQFRVVVEVHGPQRKRKPAPCPRCGELVSTTRGAIQHCLGKTPESRRMLNAWKRRKTAGIAWAKKGKRRKAAA